MIDLKNVVDSVAGGVVSAAEILPNVAENVAKNATDYAGAIRRDLEDLKTNMPDRPEVIPRVVFGIAGQTVGAGIGVIEAVVMGIDKTVKDIKTQTKRITK